MNKQNETRIKWIFFDFGGVLAEEGFLQGLQDLGRIKGIDQEVAFQKGHELIYSTGYLLGKGPESAFWDAMRRELNFEDSDEHLRSLMLKRFLPREWMFVLAEELKSQGFYTAILSDQVDWLDKLDEQYCFYSKFDKVFNSFELGKSKRETEIFSHVCQTLEISPEEALFLDDSSSNIQRAWESGMRGIEYRDRNQFLKDLSKDFPYINLPANKENLETAFQTQFSEEDAHYLSELVYPCLDQESINYEEIPFTEDIKNEYILMAFEERLLIPVQAKQESCWEERGLKVFPGESYFMPRMSKNLLQMASITGKFEPEQAMRELLNECGQKNITLIIDYMMQLKQQVHGFKINADKMLKLAHELELSEDLHDLADLFVILGFLSPSRSGTLAEGMAKYEINPCLFW